MTDVTKVPTLDDIYASKDAMDDIQSFTYNNVDTFVDAKSITRDTVTGRIKKMGYAVPIAYTVGIVYAANDNVKTVEEAGVIYAPLPSALPFTTSGTFIGDDDSRFFTIQFPPVETNKPFATLSDIIIDTDLEIGDYAYCYDYATGNNSGYLFFKIVAAATGTDDGGSYIDLSGSSLQAKQNFPSEISVKMFGAKGDGVTDDSTAIQAAINSLTSGGVLYFPSGNYLINSGLTVLSNITFLGEKGATIKPSDTVPSYALYGTGLSNITFESLNFEGTGTAYTSGTQRFIQLDASSDISVINCIFEKARNTALVLDGCTTVNISNCIFKNNYVYGAEIRNESSRITVNSCVFFENGSTGIATSAVGRGLVLWECSEAVVSNCVYTSNTEYGLRLYSASGDPTANRNIAINGCSFYNNGTTATGKIDLYIYDEVVGIENVVVSGCVFNTRSGNTSIAAQGTGISITGNSFKAITAQQGNAIVLYGADFVVISNNIMLGLLTAVGFSGTAGFEPNNINVSNNQIKEVVVFASGIYGSDNIIQGNYISHGGVGVSDVCMFIDKPTSSGTRVIGNIFDGWYRVSQFNLAACDVAFIDNKVMNTTNTPLRVYGTDLTQVESHGNTFDLATNPGEFGKLSINWHTNHRIEGINNVAPTTFTYAVGDKIYNSAPVPGGSIGWVCTIAGTPGTWKTFGDIAA